MTDLTIGGPAPDFTLPRNGEGTVTLSKLQGKAVVIYFYPKDSTPGCTTEAQQFRDLYPDFLAAGCEVIGVSRDSLRSHENFKTKQNLPFELVSDADEALCSLFSVIKDKKLYGKTVRGIERSTFAVDKSGTILREWRGVKVPGHAQEVLDFVRSRTTA